MLRYTIIDDLVIKCSDGSETIYPKGAKGNLLEISRHQNGSLIFYLDFDDEKLPNRFFFEDEILELKNRGDEPNGVYLYLNRDIYRSINGERYLYPNGLRGLVLDIAIKGMSDNCRKTMYKLYFGNVEKYPTEWFEQCYADDPETAIRKSNFANIRSMSKTIIFDESKYTDKEIHDPKGELLLSNIKSEIKNILSVSGFEIRETDDNRLLFWGESLCLDRHIIYAIGFEDSNIHIGYVCKDRLFHIGHGYTDLMEWKDKSDDELFGFILRNVESIELAALDEEYTDYYDEAMKTQMLFDDDDIEDIMERIGKVNT